MSLRPPLRWLERGALILGLLLLGLWARESVGSWAFQAAASRSLEARRHAAAPGAIAKPADPEGVLGRLEIPRLEIAAIVAEGTDAKTLGRAVGHVPSTARPGSAGNCGLAGHRDTFFRRLERVRTDDVIRFVTPERTYTYQVEWSRVVEPDRVETLDPTTAPALTLVTCYPFEFFGHAPQRFVVRARQVEPLALRP